MKCEDFKLFSNPHYGQEAKNSGRATNIEVTEFKAKHQRTWTPLVIASERRGEQRPLWRAVRLCGGNLTLSQGNKGSREREPSLESCSLLFTFLVLRECKKKKRKALIRDHRLHYIFLNYAKQSLKNTSGGYHSPTKLLHQSCLVYKFYPTWLFLLLKHACEKYFFL